jgi:5-methyltetrahydrofolate--homocysteine methyltransferase
MKLSEFLSVTKRPVLLDGAMGTQLAVAGLEMGGRNNLSHPDAVLAIHRKYVASGADLLITNTLTMNRVSAGTHNVPPDLREVNVAGVKLARSAVEPAGYVLGDIGSTGKMLAPYGDLPEEEAFTAFREQAGWLAEGGVHGFIVETMYDLREALCALRACKAAADLPVVVSMAFHTADKGGRTMMGDKARACAAALTEAGACAVGANCGDMDPADMPLIVAEMRAGCAVPIVAQPNAGKPRLVGEKTVFDMTPDDFAEVVGRCRLAGAMLLGGCCGTSPAHIRAIAEMLGR